MEPWWNARCEMVGFENDCALLPGWDWDSVLPYFRKSEDNEDKEVIHKSPEYHGKGGPLTVEWFPFVDPNVPYMIHGWKQLGLEVGDLNDETQVH